MSTGHQPPAGMPGSTGGEGLAPVPEPSHAERTRTLVAGTNRGILSTVALEPGGYPFGSVATYALDGDGRPLLFTSTMAEHTRNARADSRASLIVTEPVPDGSDPLAAGRATVIGDLSEVSDDERPVARDTYLAANPASGYYIDFGDFCFWRLDVRSLRYVGGYGRMSWVEAADYRAAEADPLAGGPGADVVAHMNTDHADSLLAMARTLAGREGAVTAVMTGVDRYGFDLVVAGATGREAVRIGFGARLDAAAEVRPQMVRLAAAARAPVPGGG